MDDGWADVYTNQWCSGWMGSKGSFLQAMISHLVSLVFQDLLLRLLGQGVNTIPMENRSDSHSWMSDCDLLIGNAMINYSLLAIFLEWTGTCFKRCIVQQNGCECRQSIFKVHLFSSFLPMSWWVKSRRFKNGLGRVALLRRLCSGSMIMLKKHTKSKVLQPFTKKTSCLLE